MKNTQESAPKKIQQIWKMIVYLQSLENKPESGYGMLMTTVISI
jgi:hypothetical protein